jgi:5-methylcytosine-specific restriction protein A
MGYAHGLSTGTPLRGIDFTGGEQAVVRPLEALGFSVARVPNPDWTREEIILACDLAANNGWRQLEASDQRVRLRPLAWCRRRPALIR